MTEPTRPEYEPYGVPQPETVAILPQVSPYGTEDGPGEPIAQFGPPPPPPAKKKTSIVIVSIAMVLLFGAAGVLGFLYFTEKQHSKSVSEQLAVKERDLTEATRKDKDSKDELTKAQDAQKKAEDAQKAAETANTVGAKCKDAARAVRDAGVKQDEKALEAALKDMFINC